MGWRVKGCAPSSRFSSARQPTAPPDPSGESLSHPSSHLHPGLPQRCGSITGHSFPHAGEQGASRGETPNLCWPESRGGQVVISSLSTGPVPLHTQLQVLDDPPLIPSEQLKLTPKNLKIKPESSHRL